VGALNLAITNNGASHAKAEKQGANKVIMIEPGRAFVLQIRVNKKIWKTFELIEPVPGKYLNHSWVFLLDKLGEGITST
jgi:hypothetical protein